MDIINEIVYVKNIKYTYVVTNNNNNNNQLDVSIFEIEEWRQLTKISKVFEESVLNLSRETDNIYKNINQTLKNSVYYLYYSPFSRYCGFNDLQYETLEINDIYELVFLVIERKEATTINKFRKWIKENYVNIQTHYENLLYNKIM
jgi:hypothetical protein